MPTLVISGETISVRLISRQVEIVKWVEWGKKPEARMRVPLVDVDRVVVIGRPSVTFPVMQRLLKEGIPCFFLTRRGRWLGALTPDNNRQAARRLLQYQLAGDETFKLSLGRSLVYAKIRNSRRVLQRLSGNRDESHLEEQQGIDRELANLARQAQQADSLDQLRGLEGHAAARYFSRLGKFFPPQLPFTGRSRRPPRDPANALISWTYTILLGEIDATVRAHGLDSCIGFLHGIRHGTPSLSLDLMEPLRAPVCDLLVLNILNHKILTETDFRLGHEDGGFYLRQESHRTFFTAYENAMVRQFTPARGEPHTDFRGVIEASVHAVLKAMEGETGVDFFHMP